MLGSNFQDIISNIKFKIVLKVGFNLTTGTMHSYTVTGIPVFPLKLC